jgi:hypothetical protein
LLQELTIEHKQSNKSSTIKLCSNLPDWLSFLCLSAICYKLRRPVPMAAREEGCCPCRWRVTMTPCGRCSSTACSEVAGCRSPPYRGKTNLRWSHEGRNQAKDRRQERRRVNKWGIENVAHLWPWVAIWSP